MKVGDTVVRMLGGVPMELVITELTVDRIICGPWQFDKTSGVEEDEELGWGVKFGVTGSFLKL